MNLPCSDPLLLQVPLGSRLRMHATDAWGWLRTWESGALLSLRDGAQTKVVISEPLEALERGSAPGPFDKIYLDLCPHSTPGHFTVTQEELADGKFSFMAVPGAQCEWCGSSSWCGVVAVVRAKLPEVGALLISSFLSSSFHLGMMDEVNDEE
jgi:hypothetical protein